MRTMLVLCELTQLCRMLVAWLAMSVLLSVAIGEDKPRTLVPCQIVRIHDGDSFVATVPFLFADGVSRTDMVRVQGADAWELDQSRAGTVGKISAEEIRKGVIARDVVAELLKSVDTIYLEPRRKGDVAEPHGRISAHVWLWFKTGKMLELSDFLKANGHVRTQ